MQSQPKGVITCLGFLSKRWERQVGEKWTRHLSLAASPGNGGWESRTGGKAKPEVMTRLP